MKPVPFVSTRTVRSEGPSRGVLPLLGAGTASRHAGGIAIIEPTQDRASASFAARA